MNSAGFLPDTDGWLEIDSGFGDRFHYAQGNYFEKPIMDERGILRYRMEAGKAIERTQEEMDADYTEQEVKPDEEKRIDALEQAMAAIEEGIDSV